MSRNEDLWTWSQGELISLIEQLEQAATEGEQECVRCHTKFIGRADLKWCTRDCQHGWTPAPTYEQWYATLHPNSFWIRPAYLHRKTWPT